MDVFISTLCFLLKEIPTKSRRDMKCYNKVVTEVANKI